MEAALGRLLLAAGLGFLVAPADLVEIRRLDPTIRLDIRYATTDNFLGRRLYPEARAFLRRPAPKRSSVPTAPSARRDTGC